jgi:hypothetical protein
MRVDGWRDEWVEFLVKTSKIKFHRNGIENREKRNRKFG